MQHRRVPVRAVAAAAVALMAVSAEVVVVVVVAVVMVAAVGSMQTMATTSLRLECPTHAFPRPFRSGHCEVRALRWSLAVSHRGSSCLIV